LVAQEDEQIVGVAALEQYGSERAAVFLLRSVVVRRDRRGNGIGQALVAAALAAADSSVGGTALIALLTETADGYSDRFGFSRGERDGCPVPCPRRLSSRGPARPRRGLTCGVPPLGPVQIGPPRAREGGHGAKHVDRPDQAGDHGQRGRPNGDGRIRPDSRDHREVEADQARRRAGNQSAAPSIQVPFGDREDERGRCGEQHDPGNEPDRQRNRPVPETAG
jgi:hypothetical protein